MWTPPASSVSVFPIPHAAKAAERNTEMHTDRPTESAPSGAGVPGVPVHARFRRSAGVPRLLADAARLHERRWKPWR